MPLFPGPLSRLRCMTALFLVFSFVSVGVAAAPAQAGQEKRDPREVQAREAYLAGRYRDALDIYAKVYAEKPHPTYLRNIGRCYQKLDEPEHAISSFRDYLRWAKNISPEERAEVEGYIKEMEEAQKKTAAPLPNPEPRPLPAAAPPVTGAESTQPSVLVEQPILAPVPAASPPPFYNRTWFWGLVGGVVVCGVAAGLWAGGVFSSNGRCPDGSVCR
jgi:hypothetical protein